MNWPKDVDLLDALDNLPELERLLVGRQLADIAASDVLSVLHVAASDGNVDVLTMLLDAGGQRFINFQMDTLCWTPIINAAIGGHIAAVRLLLERGADPNLADDSRASNTVLREVVHGASLEMVKLLVEHGADPHKKGWMQLSALDEARQRYKRHQDEESRAILELLENAKPVAQRDDP